MMYQLPSGRVLDIPLSLYLSMEDEEFTRELEELTAYQFGQEINDPFQGSALGDLSRGVLDIVDEVEDTDEILLQDIPLDIPEDLD